MDRASLKEEVRERLKLCYVAKLAFKKWRVDRSKLETLVEKRKELEILLEQLKGYSHSLHSDLLILEGEVLELRHAVRVKTKDDFTLKLLQSERDSVKSQLANARRGLELNHARLNSELLSRIEELDCSQKHSQGLA